MENSIEENIEILEKFKNNKIQRDKLERDVRCGGWKIGDIYKCLELDNAIDNILSDYKKVLKENEELKEKNKTLEELLQGNLYELYKYYRELAGSYQGNCIPIQKLKDKIEEILNNGEYTIIFEGDADFPDEATRIDAQKYIKLEKLQELLEGRKI